MITYSVTAFLLAYFRVVQTQATLCLATYGGAATRYVPEYSFIELWSVGGTTLWRTVLLIRHYKTMLTLCESVYLRQDEVSSSKLVHL